MEGAGNVIEVKPGSGQSTSRQLSSSQPSYSRPSFNVPSTSRQIPPKNSPKKFRPREFYRQNNQNNAPGILNSPNSPKVSESEPVPFLRSIQKVASKSPNVNILQNSAGEEVTNKSQKNNLGSGSVEAPLTSNVGNGAIPKRSPRKNQERILLGRNARTTANAENGEVLQRKPFPRHQRYYDYDELAFRKVVVVGFPAYSRMEDIVTALSPFGSCEVLLCKNRVAVVLFRSEEEALSALEASDTVKIYGEFVSIYKYHHHKYVQDLIKSNRRVVHKDYKGPDIKAPKEIDLSGDFYAQLKNIEDAIRLTQEEVSQIGTLFADIEAALKPVWPSCRAVPFGSITTGLGIKSSDADCFLELAPGRGAGAHSAHFVHKAAAHLRAQPHLFTALVPIPRANTPIVKFLHVPTNMNCDLNSKTPLGAQNSRLIRHLLASDARLAPLALLLKYWARAHSLSGTGRLTNYALLLLLLFYLQQRAILPPVHRLQGPAHSFVVESWEAGFDPSPLPAASDVTPLRDLLGGFFIFYATFQFEEFVACPLLGVPLRKSLFERSELPPSLARYTLNVRERVVCPIRTNCAMCVQDPIELSHNVASGVSARLAADLRAHFALAGAAYTRVEPVPGEFLRGALLEKPPASAEAGEGAALRLGLPPALLQRLGGEWRDTARTVLLHDLFRDMLEIRLERRAAVSKEKDVELEVYCGVCTRPVWARPKHCNARCDPRDLVARHRRITRDLAPDTHLPIEVELGFRTSSRNLTVTTSPMEGADQEAFRHLRRFLHTFVYRWFKTLLQPHLPPHDERNHLKLIDGIRDKGIRKSKPEPDEVKEETHLKAGRKEPLKATRTLRPNLPNAEPLQMKKMQANVPNAECEAEAELTRKPNRRNSPETECKMAETESETIESRASDLKEMAPPVIDFINSFIKKTDIKVDDRCEPDEKYTIDGKSKSNEVKATEELRVKMYATSKTCHEGELGRSDLEELVAGVSLDDNVGPADVTHSIGASDAT